MSEFLDKISKLSPKRLALLADELNERVQAAENQRRVPLAVIGMGCRFPGGVHDPEQFWELLSGGVDAISEVPESRWDLQELYDRNPATPGKMATRWGGFIEAPELFDAKFFGIAPTEAMSMDPQQRLLLETSWETSGTCRHCAVAPGGYEDGSVRRYLQRGLQSGGLEFAARKNLAVLRAWTFPCHGCRSHLVRAGIPGTQHGGGYFVLSVAGCSSPGLSKPATWGV